MNIQRVSLIGTILVFSILLVAGAVALLNVQATIASPGSQYVAPGGNCGPVEPCHETIQEAVDAASDGDVIKVAQGTYTGILSSVVVVTKGVSILGGYATTDWQNADPANQPTVIDGERIRRGIRIEGFNVPTITIQGFTIQNGNGLMDGGGGILIDQGIVIVQSCLITYSTTTIPGGQGGGMRIQGGHGEIFLIDNVIQNSNATKGGGIVVSDAVVTMIGNSLLNNGAFFGGGMSIDGSTTKITMNGNRIIGSQAGGFQGTGILIESNAVVEGQNDVIAQSFSGNGEGEGVYIVEGSLTARHWTVADNERYGIVVAGGTAYLTNTIAVSHTVSALQGSGVEANTTLFYGNSSNCSGDAACTNDLTGDPKFVSPSTGDYHIMAGSAAIDTGIDAGVYTDIDGEQRPLFEGFDIGADEFSFSNLIYLPAILKSD